MTSRECRYQHMGDKGGNGGQQKIHNIGLNIATFSIIDCQQSTVFYRFGIIVGVDMNIKDLDDDVARRLKEQAAAAGLSVQQYLRNELTRIASRLSPAELASGREPMSRAEFLAIRQRLRKVDEA